MRRNALLETAIVELNAAGIRDVHIARGKHVQIRWASDSRRRMYTMSSTPSDWRAPMKVRSDIRRMLRADGLRRAE
jgi:hypothetical protein